MGKEWMNQVILLQEILIITCAFPISSHQKGTSFINFVLLIKQMFGGYTKIESLYIIEKRLNMGTQVTLWLIDISFEILAVH